uniref:F-BAR domain-containing protein n=1 Tax=Angiostrongylus cantonensis TaxID=6313 RepID=A0A158PBJ2_ANGCA
LYSKTIQFDSFTFGRRFFNQLGFPSYFAQSYPFSSTLLRRTISSVKRHHYPVFSRNLLFYNELFTADEHSQLMDLDRILNTRKDGVEIAFERTKAWSNYSKDLLSYIRSRLQLEQDHARRVTALVEACRRDISKPFMPLRDVFESSFDSDIDLVGRTKEMTDHLKARVVEALDARRKEHDLQRGALKLEWTKLTKSLHDCEDMVEKCRIALKIREEAVRKARENALRSEFVTVSPINSDPIKKRRETEKKKRIEEEAVIKKTEAEKQLAISTAELRRKRKEIESAKERIVEKLRELVFQCDQTTKACASHYFKFCKYLSNIVVVFRSIPCHKNYRTLKIKGKYCEFCFDFLTTSFRRINIFKI